MGFRSQEKAILTDRLEQETAKLMVATTTAPWAITALWTPGPPGAGAGQELRRRPGLRPQTHAAQCGQGGPGVRCALPGVHGGAHGLRRGGCLVCACDMADGTRKHVCKDGPVFDAEEVEWNV
mgnify:CR=1 FL=1